jgi:glycine hydroxymethyltransferase
MDMAHISGLIATGEALSPFDYADVVTTTTHKSLRGPRSGMIFYRKDSRDFETKINGAVFPALQGGPHEHQIAGVATQLKEVMTPAFKQYIQQVKVNASAMSSKLISLGYTIASGGTDNHLVLWDLKPEKVTGSKFEKICDACMITLNKNCVPGDRSAITPGGVRIGSCALTSRKFVAADFEKVAEMLSKCLELAKEIQAKTGPKLVDFAAELKVNPGVVALRNEVNEMMVAFPIPGFDPKEMRYQHVTEK